MNSEEAKDQCSQNEELQRWPLHLADSGKSTATSIGGSVAELSASVAGRCTSQALQGGAPPV
jgi:hypothetical protein